jgi:NAD-dependent DNA ligase
MKLINPENKINNEIGTKLKHDINKVKIPYHMGSMNKLKGDDLNGINKWKKKYDDEYYIYSDKLDGISGLLIIKDNIKKLYKRGDKNISADISHLIEYIPSINNIKTDKNIVFRGELVISKNNFKKYENKMKNARNMVNGITINKTINEKILKDIDFVIYEIVDPFKNFEK